MTPTITQGHTATTDDERVANLRTAFAHEPGEAGGAVRWALRELAGARASLAAVRDAVQAAQQNADVTLDSDELLEIVNEGLALDLRDE